MAWIGLSALAQASLQWLWGVSLVIVLQYLTDLFDGKVGKLRKTGLIKWGFFMDHFLDYVFLCSILIGYSLIAPSGLEFYFMALLALIGAFLVHSYLAFAATNQFRIHFFGFGPTELRLMLILVNTAVVLTGTRHFAVSIPATVVVCVLVLILLVFHTQKKLWQVDMETKHRQ